MTTITKLHDQVPHGFQTRMQTIQHSISIGVHSLRHIPSQIRSAIPTMVRIKQAALSSFYNSIVRLGMIENLDRFVDHIHMYIAGP